MQLKDPQAALRQQIADMLRKPSPFGGQGAGPGPLSSYGIQGPGANFTDPAGNPGGFDMPGGLGTDVGSAPGPLPAPPGAMSVGNGGPDMPPPPGASVGNGGPGMPPSPDMHGINAPMPEQGMPTDPGTMPFDQILRQRKPYDVQPPGQFQFK